MQERIRQELELLRRRFPGVEYVEAGHWFKIPNFPLPPGWNRPATDACFQVVVGYPGTPPYGIYVPSGIQFNCAPPGSYVDAAVTQPPFGGQWGFFSWRPSDGEWRPTVDLSSGPNLLNWVLGFRDRFGEGV